MVFTAAKPQVICELRAIFCPFSTVARCADTVRVFGHMWNHSLQRPGLSQDIYTWASRFNLISEGASNVVGVDTVWDEWVENICIPKVPKQSQLWERLSKSPTAPPNSLLLPNQHSVHGPRSLVPMWTSCPQPLSTLPLLLCLISNLWKKISLKGVEGRR